MNLRDLKKVIFFIFALVNFTTSGNASETNTIQKKENKYLSSNNWTKFIPKDIKLPKNVVFQKYQKDLDKSLVDNSSPTFEKFAPLLLAKFSNSKDEVEIQSEIQSEENNVLYAEGNVIVTFQGFILNADSIFYDKTHKTLKANGNVSLIFGEQIFKMGSLVYDFNKKKGSLVDVKGLINTTNFIDDLFPNLDTLNPKYIQIIRELKKDKVLNTPNNVENWYFFTDKIEIDSNKWFSDKAIFTNDLLELRQAKIEINSLEAIPEREKIRFKSSLNYFILDEKIQIPFWFGERTLTKSGENFTFQNRWKLGFDNTDKDGAFVGRKFNTINLFNDVVLDLEPQFLIQRSLQGQTKSYVSKGDSITADKVKSDTEFYDYLALDSQIKGKIENWDFEINNELNSFDFDKFSDALRVKSSLSKEITFLNSKWDKSFYGVYRDRVWNGSIGESEIYIGYGSKLEKENTWEVNGIEKTEKLSLGLANLRGESLNNKNLVTSLKGNFFYSIDQKFPILIFNPSNKFIDSSFKYIPSPIKKGITLNTKINSSYSLYEGGNSQGFIGFGAGPEFIFGNFKNKYFDYTRISLLPFYKIKDGNSKFKFDQISDKFILDIALDQQLLGPLILKSNASLNLDSDSKDYGDFINSKISLNWKKRSYEIGIFYQPHNEAGGISFNLFGFK